MIGKCKTEVFAAETRNIATTLKPLTNQTGTCLLVNFLMKMTINAKNWNLLPGVHP